MPPINGMLSTRKERATAKNRRFPGKTGGRLRNCCSTRCAPRRFCAVEIYVATRGRRSNEICVVHFRFDVADTGQGLGAGQRESRAGASTAKWPDVRFLPAVPSWRFPGGDVLARWLRKHWRSCPIKVSRNRNKGVSPAYCIILLSHRIRREFAAYPAVPKCKWFAIHAHVIVVSERRRCAISSFSQSAFRRRASSSSFQPRWCNSSLNNRSAFAVAVSCRSPPPCCIPIFPLICSSSSTRKDSSPKHQPRRNTFHSSGSSARRRSSIRRPNCLRPAALSLGILISPSSRSTRNHPGRWLGRLRYSA